MNLTVKHYGNKLFGESYFMISRNYEISANEAQEMWANFDLGNMDDCSEEEIHIRLQEKIETDINKWERNIMDRGCKNIDRSYGLVFGTETDSSERWAARENTEEQEYQEACAAIRSALNSKPEWAEIIIAHVLDDETFRSIAARTRQSEDNVSAKYQRAIKKLQKIFADHRIFDAPGRSY